MDGDILWAEHGSMDSSALASNFPRVFDDVNLEWQLLGGWAGIVYVCLLKG